jgi:RimJ/RimL family protein N-acetyltransferase
VTTTARLVLHTPAEADVPELYELYADPRVWREDPLTRHRDPGRTAGLVDFWRAAWRRDGHGMWVARSAEPATAGELVGIGGCAVRHGVAWNVGFRLRPAFWGRGLAQEIVAAAAAEARRRRPELPLTAYLLEGNERSRRTTERTGLRLAWRGPDAGNPDPAAVRLLYADRDLPSAVAEVLTRD